MVSSNKEYLIESNRTATCIHRQSYTSAVVQAPQGPYWNTAKLQVPTNPPMFMEMRLRRARNARHNPAQHRRSPDTKRNASRNCTTSRGRFVKQVCIQGVEVCRSLRRRWSREDIRRIRRFVSRDADAVVVLIAYTRACFM
jgi:hypothetical protein